MMPHVALKVREEKGESMNAYLDAIIKGIKAGCNLEGNSIVKTDEHGGAYLRVEVHALLHVLRFLHDDDSVKMRYLSDITAVDYPEREKRFDVVYTLYSFALQEWFKVKTAVAEKEEVPSATGIWEGAFYPETEVYDLFGISFKGNAFQRRLFLPEEFDGNPLRKDFVNPWEEITFK